MKNLYEKIKIEEATKSLQFLQLSEEEKIDKFLNLERTISELTTSNTFLNQENEILNNKLEGLEQELNFRKNKAKDLEKKLALNKERQKNDIRILQKTIDDLEEKVRQQSSRETYVYMLANKIKTLEKKNLELSHEKTNNTVKVDVYKHRIEKLKDEIFLLKQCTEPSINVYVSRCKSYEDEIKNLNNRLNFIVSNLNPLLDYLEGKYYEDLKLLEYLNNF